jgi:hypothetical protein
MTLSDFLEHARRLQGTRHGDCARQSEAVAFRDGDGIDYFDDRTLGHLRTLRLASNDPELNADIDEAITWAEQHNKLVDA